MQYVDQSQKLDVQSLVTAALKQPGAIHYSHTVRMDDWPQITDQPDSNLLAIEIDFDRPLAMPAIEPVFGLMRLWFTTPDGRQSGQHLRIMGQPTTKASWRWKVVWPDGERVQTLYFQNTGGGFNSRKAAGLKYRRKRSNRPRNRLRHHLRELGAVSPNGFIPKPLWMTETKYQYHLYEINMALIQLLSKALNVWPPDFYDEGEQLDLKTRLARVQHKDPPSIYRRDQSGSVQIKAKYLRKYGLPNDGAPDLITHLWFAIPRTAAK